MVRRIGFGAPDTGETRKPTIEREKRTFGIRPATDRSAGTPDGKPRFSGRFENPLIPRDDSPAGRRRAKWIIVGFLSIWLAGWSYGLLQAFSTFGSSSGFGAIFMGVWILFGALGWVVVVFILFMLLFGKELKRATPRK